MINEEQFVQKEFNLPDHSNELSKAEDQIEKLKIVFNEVRLIYAKSDEKITGQQHEKIFEAAIRAVDFVGRLSMPVFEAADQLEELYIKQYPRSPELAKSMWLKHSDLLHHPYSLLKNRCWRLIEELDEYYFSIHQTEPPNWKP